MTDMMHDPLALSAILAVLIFVLALFYLVIRVAMSRAEAKQRAVATSETAALRAPELSE